MMKTDEHAIRETVQQADVKATPLPGGGCPMTHNTSRELQEVPEFVPILAELFVIADYYASVVARWRGITREPCSHDEFFRPCLRYATDRLSELDYQVSFGWVADPRFAAVQEEPTSPGCDPHSGCRLDEMGMCPKANVR